MRPDVNGNGLPDECETDCNGNLVPDDWEAGRTRPDCNGNHVPDECDSDCDEDGIIDDCETVQDSDADGFSDCLDQCRFSTPTGACAPPNQITCKFTSGSCFQVPRSICVSQNGVVYCGEPGNCEGDPCPDTFCRDGCQPGDYDGDADRDLRDFGAFANCHTGEPAFELPSDICRSRFDLDDDGDIDLQDFYAIHFYWQNWNGN